MKFADYLKKDIAYWPNWLNNILLRLNVFGKLIFGYSYFKLRKRLYDKKPEELLIESVNYAIKNVPYYREKYGNLIIHTLKDFEDNIEFINKDIVMSNWDKFLVDNINLSKCNIGTTSGTSGKPLKLVTPTNRYKRESLFIHSVREPSGWRVGVIKALIRNHRLPVNRDYMINPVTKELIFDAFRIDEKYSKTTYNIIKKHKVDVIHAYPSAVYQFFKLCEKQNLDLSIIKICLLSSEAVTDEQIWYISKHLNIKINYTYGHSEKLILAANDDESFDLLVEPYYGYFELIDENGEKINKIGKIGEMVGSTFFNRHMPLIRYKTGDFAEYGGIEKNANSIEKIILNKIHGRRDKSIIYKANGTTTSLTSLNLHGEFYEHIDGIQYIQERTGYITILIIKNSLYNKTDEDFITDHVGNVMGGMRYVSVKYVDKLIFQDNGKFLPLISRLLN